MYGACMLERKADHFRLQTRPTSEVVHVLTPKHHVWPYANYIVVSPGLILNRGLSASPSLYSYSAR